MLNAREGLEGSMGRTVPSFRIAEAQEFGEWKGFRRALPKRERQVFDEMLSTARLYTSASSAAVRTSRFEGMAMAIIFRHRRLLEQCAEALPLRSPEGPDRGAQTQGEDHVPRRRTLISIPPPFNVSDNDGNGEGVEQVSGGDTGEAPERCGNQPRG